MVLIKTELYCCYQSNTRKSIEPSFDFKPQLSSKIDWFSQKIPSTDLFCLKALQWYVIKNILLIEEFMLSRRIQELVKESKQANCPSSRELKNLSFSFPGKIALVDHPKESYQRRRHVWQSHIAVWSGNFTVLWKRCDRICVLLIKEFISTRLFSPNWVHVAGHPSSAPSHAVSLNLKRSSTKKKSIAKGSHQLKKMEFCE